MVTSVPTSWFSASAALCFAAVPHPVRTRRGEEGPKDCDDFKSQKKAQKWFKKHNPRRDPAGLDADNDGIACEDNPCPCSYKASSRAPVVAGRL